MGDRGDGAERGPAATDPAGGEAWGHVYATRNQMKSEPAFADQRRLDSLPLGMRLAADERPIEKISNADSKRNDADRGSRPDVTIRLDARNQAKSSDVAERAADEQEARDRKSVV